MKTLTPDQKQINKLTRELRSLYSQLSYTQIARDQWRKKCAAKDEKGGRSAASTIAGLREGRARDLARYQEHLSQKVRALEANKVTIADMKRALEANKVTIADMNLELKQLRDSYDAKRDLALRWQNAYAGKVAELDAAERKGKSRIDSPKNWALLNKRDEQWISSLQQLVWSAQNLMEKGPTPPMQPAPPAYTEDPDHPGYHHLNSYRGIDPRLDRTSPDDVPPHGPVEGDSPVTPFLGERRTKDLLVQKLNELNKARTRQSKASARLMAKIQKLQEKTSVALLKGAKGMMGTPVPGGNGVGYQKRKARKK